MQVNINLLQRKERSNRFFYFLLAAFCLFGLIFAAFLFHTLQKTTKNIQAVERQLNAIEQKNNDLKKQIKISDRSSSIDKLEKIVQSAEKLPTNTVDLLTKLTALLPEKASFQSLQYKGNNILLEINVADDIDAAFYYKHLADAKWTKNVKLDSVTANRGEVSEFDTVPISYTAKYEIEIDRSQLKNERTGGD